MNTIVQYFTNKFYTYHLGAFNDVGDPLITPSGDITNGYTITPDGTSDFCGKTSIDPHGTNVAGSVYVLTFNKPFTRAPLVYLSFGDDLSPGKFYATSTTTTMTLLTNVSLDNTEVYSVNYLCIEPCP